MRGKRYDETDEEYLRDVLGPGYEHLPVLVVVAAVMVLVLTLILP